MTPGTGIQRLHATVEGWVQGVGFRAFVVDLSTKFAVTGWVRNTMEGHVEIMAEGSRSQLDQFLAHLRTGPRMARVVNVQVEWQAATGEYSFFSVERTA
jgi:acylphosphatase